MWRWSIFWRFIVLLPQKRSSSPYKLYFYSISINIWHTSIVIMLKWDYLSMISWKYTRLKGSASIEVLLWVMLHMEEGKVKLFEAGKLRKIVCSRFITEIWFLSTVCCSQKEAVDLYLSLASFSALIASLPSANHCYFLPVLRGKQRPLGARREQ